MSRHRYYCNPEVFFRVMKVTSKYFMPPEMPFLPTGSELVPNPAVPMHPRRWEFPKERMFEYDASDEVWCRYFGIGREVEDTSKFLMIRIMDQFWNRDWWSIKP